MSSDEEEPAQSPRAVAVWEVTRAAEHATASQRADALAVLTGETARPIPLDDMESAVLGALAELPRGMHATATQLVGDGPGSSGYRNRQIVARVLRFLGHIGYVQHSAHGWAITPLGRQANAI